MEQNNVEMDRTMLLVAARMAETALLEAAQLAEDNPFWNHGGVGYIAYSAIRAAISQAERRV